METLEQGSVTHSTFVIERSYAVTPERVFAAFADPAKKRRWFFPEQGAQVEEHEMDFRVGGAERKTFRAEQGMSCRNDTIYQDIVPGKRIVFAYTMSVAGRRISASQATVELLPEGTKTRLIFTEQAAFFEGADGPQMRQNGWGSLFKQLERFLAQS
jgi:uncharacterized protein YndB with AHSA1/START domain